MGRNQIDKAIQRKAIEWWMLHANMLDMNSNRPMDHCPEYSSSNIDNKRTYENSIYKLIQYGNQKKSLSSSRQYKFVCEKRMWYDGAANRHRQENNQETRTKKKRKKPTHITISSSQLIQQIFHSFKQHTCIQYTSFATIYFIQFCFVCLTAVLLRSRLGFRVFVGWAYSIDNTTEWWNKAKKATSHYGWMTDESKKKLTEREVHINLCDISNSSLRTSTISSYWKEVWLNVVHTLDKWIVRVFFFWHERNLLASININGFISTLFLDSLWLQ